MKKLNSRSRAPGLLGISLQLSSFCCKQSSESRYFRDNFLILVAGSNKVMFPGLGMNTHPTSPKAFLSVNRCAQIVKSPKRPPGVRTRYNRTRVFIQVRGWATNLLDGTGRGVHPRSKVKEVYKGKPQVGVSKPWHYMRG